MHTEPKDHTELTDCMQSCEVPSEPTDRSFEFVDADTPTVQYRHRLSLSHRTLTRTEHQPSSLDRINRPGEISRPIEITDGLVGEDEVTGPPEETVNLSTETMEQGQRNMDLTDDVRMSVLSQEIEVLDSEDEELQRALEESYNDISTARPVKGEVQLSDVLKEFQGNVNTSAKQEIIISRKRVLQSAFRALNRRFDTTCNLYVKFSGEMGLDYGGPRREFFRLVLREMCDSSMFEGPQNSRFFTHDIKKLEGKEYLMGGKLVAMSVLHEGPAIHFLNEHLCKLMLGINSDLASFDLNSLPDDEWKAILLQLTEADTDQKRDKFLSQNGEWLINQGYTGAWQLKTDERDAVIETLIKQFIYYRTLPEICQFTEGMDSVFGLWTVMKLNADVCLDLLSGKMKPLLKNTFMALLTTNWSDEGTNKRLLEEDTIYSWEIFLQDVEDRTVGVTFEELLIFVTGADVVPPCGFPSKIVIEFYTNEHGTKRLPFVSTCAMTLSLPRGVGDPDEFRPTMVRAIKESCGFGKI